MSSKSFSFFEIGDIVFSAAGHDKCKYFAVTGIADEIHVLIADGRSRKIDKPKKKKIKHLKLIKKVDSGYIEISVKRKLTNSALRKHIAAVLSGIPAEELPDENNGVKLKKE